jgi:hypothetical protein
MKQNYESIKLQLDAMTQYAMNLKQKLKQYEPES